MESAKNSSCAASAFRVKEEDGENVTLRVDQQNTPAFYFTMKRDEPLLKLMTAYCETLKLGDYNGLMMFIADGARIRRHQTPNELQLENDDVIDVWIPQTGC